MDQKNLNELKVGEKVDHFLVVTKIEERLTKNGKPFLSIDLRDKSGEINAKVWDNFDAFLKEAESGKVIKVIGKIEEFNNVPQIKVESIRITTTEDNVRAEEFMPKSERDLKTMEKELESRITQIKNSKLTALIKKILSSEKFETYKKVPAGKAWHHAYIHGLLEHTLEIIRICDLMCDIHPDVNRDLLITGAILHDFGKTEELNHEVNFEYTDKGKLLGHIVIAAMEIENAANSIKDFPVDLKNQLIHLVLSHQGKLEHASPVEPKTVEAIILYHADELSAKTNAYKNAIKADENKEGNWTRYLPLAGTSLYIPEIESDSEEGTLFDNH